MGYSGAATKKRVQDNNPSKISADANTIPPISHCIILVSFLYCTPMAQKKQLSN